MMAALLPYLASAGGGALLSSILSKHGSGTEPYLKKFQTLNHGQKSLLNSLLQHPDKHFPTAESNPLYQQGSGYLSGILSQDPEMMKQFEAPMMRQFNEETVPGIAERFSGMGARNSSAFNQTMGQAAGSLSERLAAMRAGLGMQASGMAQDYAQLPFNQNMARTTLGLGTPAFGYANMGGSPGMSQGIASGVGQALPLMLMHLLGS